MPVKNHNYLMALAMNADVGTLHLNSHAIPVKIVEVESDGGKYSSPMTTFKCLVVNDDQIKQYAKERLNSIYGAPRGGFTLDNPRYAIKRVYFNNPVTVVLWMDGTKTIVRCQEGDTYSEETGLAMAIAKKVFGNKGNFNEVFKKFIPGYGKGEAADEMPEV